jgi:hypothetical protein
MLPFRNPATRPTPTVALRPGARSSAKPRQIRMTAPKTTQASATRSASAGSEASARMPNGVATQVPASSSQSERHSTSRQTWRSRPMLVATSNISTIGTTCSGGSTSDRLVTQTIEAPKPV